MSKLGATQIRWLSKPLLFDFDVKYRTGKSNQAADALNHHPKSIEDSSSDVESKEYKTILYTLVNGDLTNIVNRVTLPIDIKQEIQRNIQDNPEENTIKSSSTIGDVPSKVSPEIMRQAQREDLDICKAMCYVKSRKKLSLAQFRKIK